MIPEVLPPPTPAGAAQPPSARVDSAAFDHALRSAVDAADERGPRATGNERHRSERRDEDRPSASEEAGAAGITGRPQSPSHHDTRTASGGDGSADAAGRSAESPDAVTQDGPTSDDVASDDVASDAVTPDHTTPERTADAPGSGDPPSAAGSEDVDAAIEPTDAASPGRPSLNPAGHVPAGPAAGAASAQGRVHAADPALEHSPALTEVTTETAPSDATTDADGQTTDVADDAAGVPPDADGAEAAGEPSPGATEEPATTDPDAAVDAQTDRNRQPDATTRGAAARATHVGPSMATGPMTTVDATTTPTPQGPVAEHSGRQDVSAPRVEPAPTHAAPAAAPAPPPAPAAPTAASIPAAPATAPPAPVVDQLVGHVSPFIGGPEGSHEITIELAPAELGRVRLRVTLDDGVIHVRVHADDPASRRLLARSMGELRHALVDAGVRAGDLDVRDQAWSGPRDDGHAGAGSEPRADAVHAADVAPARRTTSPVTPRSAVDVLL